MPSVSQTPAYCWLVLALAGPARSRQPFVSRDVLLAAAAAYDALYRDEDGYVDATFNVRRALIVFALNGTVCFCKRVWCARYVIQ